MKERPEFVTDEHLEYLDDLREPGGIMNEYESCKTDIGIVRAAKVADELDNLNLNEVLAEWFKVISFCVGGYACDNGIDIDWEEEHPLNIIMLDKASELMGLELRGNSLAKVNNAYDWLASVISGGK